MAQNGFFLVIEGTDGSGKGTQVELLTSSLTKDGFDVVTFDFPQYKKPSSYFIKKYLNGEYGSMDEVGPYTASMFYALDRYESAPAIKAALEAGKVVIANRFTGSNMAHQGTKFDDEAERKGYFLWLEAIEFQMLGIPRPDLSLVLRVPADIAQNLVDKKETRTYTKHKRDIHEADLSHLEKSVQVYDSLCQLFPKDFKALDCVRNGTLLDIATIQKLIRETINPLLPISKRSSATNYQQYYVPDTLDKNTKDAYVSIIDSVYATKTKIKQSLKKYIDTYADTPADQRDTTWEADVAQQINAATQGLQPAATGKLIPNNKSSLASDFLPTTYSTDTAQLQLIEVTPRNELNVIPQILYPQSGHSFSEIKREVSKWTYNQKASTLENDTLRHAALRHVRYTWDILDEYTLFDLMRQWIPDATFTPQTLTPRHGYDIPELIDVANLTDEYESCFDASLKLYSILQSAGFEHEAQYATLFGHRIRWKVTFNADEALQLFKLQSSQLDHPKYRKLLQQMYEKISEIHPLLAKATN